MPAALPSTPSDSAAQTLEIASDRFHAALSKRVSASIYNLWIKPIRPIAVTESQLLVVAPPKILPWLQSRYQDLLSAAATAALARPISVVLHPASNTAISHQSSAFSPAVPDPTSTHAHPLPFPPAPTLETVNPLHTFSTFVIGPSNHFAHAAALAVAESPSSTYNPFVLSGAPGLGKTHLLHAITHFIRAHNPTTSVVYTTADQFTSAFISSLKKGTIDHMQRQLRSADVLLVDGIHTLDKKPQTQKEMARTLDHLIQLDKQVVLSTLPPLHDSTALDERLQSLLRSGLRADLDTPDLNTRLAVLHKQVSEDSVVINDPAALPSLARLIPADPRTLLSALVRVIAFASLTRRPITASLVDEVTTSLYPHLTQQRPTSIDRIIDLTAQAFDLRPADLLGPSRTARIVSSRHIAMYLTRRLTDLSLPKIGSRFGGRDHATVLHASRKITRQIDVDENLRRVVDNLLSTLDEAP